MVTKVDKSAFDLLGKRWSALIIQDLIGGPRRFRELLTHVGRINDKVLSQRLKELDERGIVVRSVYAEVPVRVEYTLTDKGRSLAKVIREMEQWDVNWSGGAPRRPHADEAAPAAPAPAAPVVEAMRQAETMAAPAAETHPAADREQRGFWRRLGL
ncbi:MAG: transcriptional regulator [Dehalococcoidia bacterium]|nr:transcriptional regulator [Dehalococcoidia bacterium]